MKKTKKELNQLKEESALNTKLNNLSEEELKEVAGGKKITPRDLDRAVDELLK